MARALPASDAKFFRPHETPISQRHFEVRGVDEHCSTPHQQTVNMAPAAGGKKQKKKWSKGKGAFFSMDRWQQAMLIRLQCSQGQVQPRRCSRQGHRR